MGIMHKGLAGLVFGTGIVFCSSAYAQTNVDDSVNAGLRTHYYDLKERFGVGDREHALIVDGKTQKAYLVCEEDSTFCIVDDYDVSTGKNGYGNSPHSYKTPIGVHKVQAKNGAGAEVGTVFKKGTSTGKAVSISQKEKDDRVGLLVTRILRLEGCESKNSNSFVRGIFLHGTNREGSIGRPDSGGCVRMRSEDIIELYPFLDVGSYVKIVENLTSNF